MDASTHPPPTPVPSAPPSFGEELERVYRTRFAQMLAVARGLTGDAEAAREAVQDAFAAMLAGAGPRDVSAREAYIWRSVVNAAHDARRRRRRADRLRMRGADAAERRTLDTPDEHGVRRAIATLPRKQRTALLLRHYADLDYAGIARVMGVSPGTVGSTLNAAHAAMRHALREAETDGRR